MGTQVLVPNIQQDYQKNRRIKILKKIQIHETRILQNNLDYIYTKYAIVLMYFKLYKMLFFFQ